MSHLKRLLILDDDTIVAMIISATAQRAGFETCLCNCADEFMSYVNSWSPSHITLDLVMPSVDGVEVMQKLAMAGCEAQIIISSGMGNKVIAAARRFAEERGLRVSGILPKPFRVQQLLTLLQHADCARREKISSGLLTFRLDEILVGLESNQFVLHFQPKIRLSDGRLSGFEGLARWKHPVHGIVFPDAFVPALERSGEIVHLTRRVIDHALQWLRETSDTQLSINLSARDLGDYTLADRLEKLCRDCDVEPARLVLELTETGAMQDATMALDILTRLRIKGFKLGIDDFGTGYSSMVQLSRLPFSEVKIDRSFVMSMRESDESYKIVAATISLGQSLGLTTIAEGVEDEETAQLLEYLGCDLGQGYHFGRPMAEVAQFLAS